MNRVLFTPAFKGRFKRFLRKHSQLKQRIANTLAQLKSDHSHPTLHTHKLNSDSEFWACSCAYDLRIIFTIERDEKTNERLIVLHDLGTHDDVY